MDLIQFLVEIILQSFAEAQIWKKQPFLSSLFRWIIVHYLCYTLMCGCFHRDRCSAICKHILETVFAKSLLDSWGGKQYGRGGGGGGRRVGWRTKRQQGMWFLEKNLHWKSANVKPRLPPHTSSSNSPSSVDSQDIWLHLLPPCMHFLSWEITLSLSMIY